MTDDRKTKTMFPFPHAATTGVGKESHTIYYNNKVSVAIDRYDAAGRYDITDK